MLETRAFQINIQISFLDQCVIDLCPHTTLRLTNLVIISQCFYSGFEICHTYVSYACMLVIKILSCITDQNIMAPKIRLIHNLNAPIDSADRLRNRCIWILIKSQTGRNLLREYFTINIDKKATKPEQNSSFLGVEFSL